MRQDLVSDVMYVLNNADKFGKQDCTLPASDLVKNVLMVAQKAGYVGSFEFIDDGKSGMFKVDMTGKINMSRSIKPRFSVKKNDYEKWENRFLPAKNVGVLIVSTNKGIMTQKDAETQSLGGKLLAFIY